MARMQTLLVLLAIFCCSGLAAGTDTDTMDSDLVQYFSVKNYTLYSTLWIAVQAGNLDRKSVSADDLLPCICVFSSCYWCAYMYEADLHSIIKLGVPSRVPKRKQPGDHDIRTYQVR